MRAGAHYLGCVGQVGYVARRYGLDVLIVLAAAAGVIEVVVEHGSSERAALGSVVRRVGCRPSSCLSLLACQRLPFAAPATLWLLVAALSFIDGRLVPLRGRESFSPGMAAAILLGSLPRHRCRRESGWRSCLAAR